MLLALALQGCGPAPPTITLDDDILMLASAAWARHPEAETRVEVLGPDGDFLVTDWAAAGSGLVEMPLLGLWADTDWTAVVTTPEGEVSLGVPFTTGPVHSHTPNYTVEGEAGWEGYLVTALLGSPATVVVLDETGRVVWHRQAEPGFRAFRAMVNPEQTGLAYSHIAPDGEDGSAIVEVDWGGAEISNRATPRLSHDFTYTADGRVVYVKYEDGLGADGVEILGNAVMRMDADGEVETLWSTFDAFEAPASTELPEGESWTHANAIDAVGSDLWVSLRNPGELVQIREDGSTGDIIGGERSTYAIANPDHTPMFQHQFEFVDGGVVMLDDRVLADKSRVLELALDADAATAEARWQWKHPEDFWLYALGDVSRLPDGGTLAVWSSLGVITDIGPDDAVRWELRTELAVGIPYVQRLESLPGVHRVR